MSNLTDIISEYQVVCVRRPCDVTDIFKGCKPICSIQWYIVVRSQRRKIFSRNACIIRAPPPHNKYNDRILFTQHRPIAYRRQQIGVASDFDGVSVNKRCYLFKFKVTIQYCR